ncbi:MAG TPA: NAD(P)/FAD-dependent oxidoreductase [Solirubrobacteraceae bacterium]|nr:NAD(P)/FAD-dependent oxidoreductase [Solirubrobacteraceae bacterium]
MSEHDVIVLGAGPAGEVASGLLAGEGLDVAVVERELVGGECAFWACMPSKALLRPGELLAEDRRVPGVPTGELDARRVLTRRDQVIHDLDDASQLPWLEDRGITLYRGQARFDGPRAVSVQNGDGAIETLRARRAVIIAVGSGAAIPPVPGLREIAPWTNREATTARQVPGSMIVLGGGAVGCEMAQAWSSLGSQITLVESMDGLLPHAEPFAGELVAEALKEQGVAVHTGATATEAGRGNEGEFRLSLESGEELVADELLVCVGRRPHTDDLGLETIDLNPGDTIRVDAQMRVPLHADWLYAVGDVNGRSLVTHAGKYQAAIAAATIMNRAASADWDGPLSPQVVFTEPQVASVGYTLQRALDAGIQARAVEGDPAATPGGSFVGKGGRSGARIVIDEQREVIVGATFVGPEIAESLQAATIAVVGEVPLRRLAHAMPAFPTRSEMWLRLLADWRP